MRDIFVAITAYRDDQLVPTIVDLLEKTKVSISIGVVWQGLPEDEHLLEGLPACYLLKVDAKKTGGAGWARWRVRHLYNKEEWFFQIDSHCRFEEDWAEKLIEQWHRCNNPRAVLSSYPDVFIPPDILEARYCYGIRPVRFKDRNPGSLEQRAYRMDGNVPRRGYLISGGFVFGPGEVAKVGYNPYIYFQGEEIVYAVTLFTHGWDVYHCPVPILYHYYTRSDYPKHWSDFPEEYAKLNALSMECCKDVLWNSRYLGSVRSLREFEAASSINFKYLQCSWAHLPPPVFQ